MRHAIELAAILLLMAIGQGVIDVSGHVLRRVLFSFVSWAAAFAAAIVFLSASSLVAPAIRIAVVVLAAYMLRWFFSSLVIHFRGPVLLEPLRAVEVAAAAHAATGLPFEVTRQMARRVERRFDGYPCLAGLVLMVVPRDATPEALEEEWLAACARAQDIVKGLIGADAPAARRFSGAAAEFVTQALCLYDMGSVRRILSKLPAGTLNTRSGRLRAAAELDKNAERSRRAEALGIVSSETPMLPPDGNRIVRIETILWPAAGIHRAGFSRRAIALSLAHAALLSYGIGSVLFGSIPAGLVFLGVAALIHIQSALALADFRWLAGHGPGAVAAGGRNL